MATSWKVRAAAVVGAVFGGLGIVAGTRVLTGLDTPDYTVLPWLVVYNVVAGVVGVGVGLGVWQRRGWAATAALALAGGHAAVLMALAARLAVGGEVANDSLMAMTLRVIVWSGIAWIAQRAGRSRG
ncbi:MAG: hypothetical protein KA371_03570 [Acidobacteria bacterium]|nr:hypothetical protein [Acidobacteriota bacterium]